MTSRNVLMSILVAGMCALLSGAAAAPSPATQPQPLAEPDKDGFISLFNGKDLSGWMLRNGQPVTGGWVVEDNALVRKTKAADIWTQHRFSDFILELEFKTAGNSGVFFRTDKPMDNVQTGIEMQVLTPVATPNKHSCGAIYDCLPPSKEAGKKGDWNHVVLTCKDNQITVVLNGEKVIDMDLNQWDKPGKNPDGSGNKFKKALKDFKRDGHIGLQEHGANVSYRNIRIKPLAR